MFGKLYWQSSSLPAARPGLVEAELNFDKKPTAGHGRGFFAENPPTAGHNPKQL